MLSEIVDYRLTSLRKDNRQTRGFLSPYMVSCNIANTAYVPEAVSLVSARHLKHRACLKDKLDIPTNCLAVKKGWRVCVLQSTIVHF